MAPAVPYAPAGSTSANFKPAFNTDAMDPTPPSQGVIFQTRHPVAALPQPTCPPVYLQSVSRQTAISNILFDPGISSQPTFGACDGRQPNDSFLVGKLAAPAQAITWEPCGHSMASAVGGASTIPACTRTSSSTFTPSTRGPPVRIQVVRWERTTPIP
ncbi:hypothetical protein HPG69_007652 [Diceros bicornis minor]|uniref:Uncharacterized protein n=1 Tax=Diceros bicornis minor TaxID=77932 RepID=A0A7J7EAF4_DICBM|nr:hypothetical protein HPG69_007652 [Diceros bicornis minor]